MYWQTSWQPRCVLASLACGCGRRRLFRLASVLLATYVFHSLYHERRDYWERTVAGPSLERAGVWELLKDDVRQHPVLRNQCLSRVVPIGLHGDGGAFNKQDTVLVLTWNSLVGHGTAREKRHIITVIKKTQMRGDGSTLAVILK